MAVTAKVSLEEWDFVRLYLNTKEQALFEKLQLSEQKHSINVATDIAKEMMDEDINKVFLIRLGLLHDIGKIHVKLGPVGKGVIVILDKLTRGKLKKYGQYKKINSYYNHGEIGCKILRGIDNYHEGFLEIIKNHHYDSLKDNPFLDVLQKHDNNN